MQKRKVLFVVHQLNYGGVQKSLLAALNAIDYTQNEITLYIRKNRIPLLDEINPNVHQVIINKDKTHYYRKPYMIFLLGCKMLFHLLKKERKRDRIQERIVEYLNHAQMKYEKTHYPELSESYDVAISYIQSYTAKFVGKYVNAKKKIMFFHVSVDENHKLHEEIMPFFDNIVGVNENVQRILEELYPEVACKMTYIENYVDAEMIREKAKTFTIEKEEGRIVLCSCGRFAPVKGFDLALEAARELRRSDIDFLWYFVGDGPELENIERMIKQYNLEQNIVITGMKDNPYPYIAACDIYIQPSYEEAHSLSIIEAMILGKPIVTTATVGGKALVMNDITGIISEINGKSLYECICSLAINYAKRKDMVHNLRTIDYLKKRDEYKSAWEKILNEPPSETKF